MYGGWKQQAQQARQSTSAPAPAQTPPWVKKAQSATPQASAAPLRPSWQAQRPATIAPKFEADPEEGPTYEAKVIKYTKEVEALDKVLTTVLDNASKALENENASGSALKASMESLEKQSTKLKELNDPLTKDCDEGRKAALRNPLLRTIVPQLVKLLTQSKSFQQKVLLATNRLKPKVVKAERESELKNKEAKDAAAWKTAYAKLTKEITAAEDAVKGLAKKAAPIITTPPEGEELDKKVAAIVVAADEALKKVEAAKKELQEKFKAAQDYAPEAKKATIANIGECQKKLTEAQKAGQVYKIFKTSLPKMIEGGKVVAEVTEKLSGHDTAISKATRLSEVTKLTKPQSKAIDEHIEPLLKNVNAATSIINIKMKVSDEATKAKLTELKAKADDLKKKCDGILAKIKGQREIFKSEEAIEVGKEHVQKVEASIEACQKAEMPFLTGVEVLPGDENDKALKECSDAITASSAALEEGKKWLVQKLAECKGYDKELNASTNAELTPMMATLKEAEQQVIKYKREFNERKMAAIMDEAVEATIAFEKKVKVMEAESKGLKSTSLEDEDEEMIKDMMEKCKKAANESDDSRLAAKKVLSAKMKEAKVGNLDPLVSKLAKRIEEGASKATAVRNVIKAAEVLLQTKEAINKGEEQMKEAEVAVSKTTAIAEKGLSTVEAVQEADEAMSAASSLLLKVSGTVSGRISGATAKCKEHLQALMDRHKEAKKQVEQARADVKDQREQVLCDSYMEESEKKTAAAEAAAVVMEEAEMPFLTGASMELQQRLETVAKCEAGVKAVSETGKDAKAYISQKSAVLTKFGAEVTKKIKDAFKEQSDRLQKVYSKLPAFEKDLKDRIKGARLLEASTKVDEVEELLKKMAELAEPFTKEGADKMTEEEAAGPLEPLLSAESAVTKLQNSCLAFVKARVTEQKSDAENTATLKGLEERLATVKKDIVATKKPALAHEQRALATKLLAESKKIVDSLRGEVNQATETLAPLFVDEGVAFLVGTSMDTLTSVLLTHMTKNGLTIADYWKEISKGKAMNEEAFVAYLTELAKTIDEVNALTDERRAAMFKRISADEKSVNEADFAKLFNRHCHCTSSVVVTDKFEVDSSETLGKLIQGAEVAVSGLPREDDKGLLRFECTFEDKKGWVTQKQNKTSYLSPVSSFKIFCNNSDKVLTACGSAIAKATSTINANMKQGGPQSEGPLKDAREEMNGMKDTCTGLQKELDELRKKSNVARSEFKAKEKTELNAHVELRNAREAAPFVDAARALVEEIEAAAIGAEEAGAPLTTLTGEALLSFETPVSVQEAVDAKSTIVTEKAAEAKDTIKEQTKAASEVSPQSGGTAEAKRLLGQLGTRTASAVAKAHKVVNAVKSKSQLIINPKMEPTAAAIRKALERKGVSGEQFFNTLKKGDKIAEGTFCKLLASLDGANLSSEVAQLICRKLELDGVSKDTFMKYVVLYYKVVKTIAFTDIFQVSKCKTLRKIEIGEVLELLAGPDKEEDSGMSRIKAKALSGEACEGWVTMSGTSGTTFLEKTTKPGEKKPEEKKADDKSPAKILPKAAEKKK